MTGLQETDQLLETYGSVRSTILAARSSVCRAVNSAMVFAYWEIGRQVVEASGGKERAEYGEGLLKYLAKRLSAEFGNAFSERNLRYMRQFFLLFPMRNALRSELSWTHYRLIMRVENEKARAFYLDECVRENWSTRQLERQITTFFYERLLVRRVGRGTRPTSAEQIFDLRSGAVAGWTRNADDLSRARLCLATKPKVCESARGGDILFC